MHLRWSTPTQPSFMDQPPLLCSLAPAIINTGCFALTATGAACRASPWARCLAPSTHRRSRDRIRCTRRRKGCLMETYQRIHIEDLRSSIYCSTHHILPLKRGALNINSASIHIQLSFSKCWVAGRDCKEQEIEGWIMHYPSTTSGGDRESRFIIIFPPFLQAEVRPKFRYIQYHRGIIHEAICSRSWLCYVVVGPHVVQTHWGQKQNDSELK